MQIQLPNGISIILGMALVAALTAIAGALPGEVPDWTGLAAAAVIGGVAKAIQVWLDSQKHLPEIPPEALADGVTLSLERSSSWRRWLVE